VFIPGNKEEVYFYTPDKNYPSPFSVRETNKSSCAIQPKYKQSYSVDLKLGDN